MIAVSEYNDISRLDPLRRLWRSLWERTRERSFFQSLEWLEGYWRHFGSDATLRVLMVSVGGRPIGIVPLVVKTTTTPLGTVRVLTDPLEDWGTFFRPVGPHPAATLKAAFDHLRKSPRDWDVINLRHVDADGADNGRTRNALQSGGMTVQTSIERTLPAITVEQYVMSGSERLLDQPGRLAFRRYRPSMRSFRNDRHGWAMLDDFTQLSSAAVDARSAFGVERHLVVHFDCLRDVHEAALEAGVVDLSLIYRDGDPVAGVYGYQCDGLVELVQAVANEHALPETERVLMSRMLEDSVERGDRRLLFNAATSSLAEGWSTTPVRSHRYTHFAATGPKAQLLRMNCRLRSWFGEGLPTFAGHASQAAPIANKLVPTTAMSAEGTTAACGRQDRQHDLRVYPAPT